jgi:hypothetical protein
MSYGKRRFTATSTLFAGCPVRRESRVCVLYSHSAKHASQSLVRPCPLRPGARSPGTVAPCTRGRAAIACAGAGAPPAPAADDDAAAAAAAGPVRADGVDRRRRCCRLGHCALVKRRGCMRAHRGCANAQGHTVGAVITGAMSGGGSSEPAPAAAAPVPTYAPPAQTSSSQQNGPCSFEFNVR